MAFSATNMLLSILLTAVGRDLSKLSQIVSHIDLTLQQLSLPSEKSPGSLRWLTWPCLMWGLLSVQPVQFFLPNNISAQSFPVSPGSFISSQTHSLLCMEILPLVICMMAFLSFLMFQILSHPNSKRPSSVATLDGFLHPSFLPCSTWSMSSVVRGTFQAVSPMWYLTQSRLVSVCLLGYYHLLLQNDYSMKTETMSLFFSTLHHSALCLTHADPICFWKIE